VKQITRKVTLVDLRDLLDDPPRANVAWIDADGIRAAPVRFRLIDGRYWICGRGDGPGASPAAGQRVVLLIDDGYLYFDLRGARIAGRTERSGTAPAEFHGDANWLELIVERTTAWHYGFLRRRQG